METYGWRRYRWLGYVFLIVVFLAVFLLRFGPLFQDYFNRDVRIQNQVRIAAAARDIHFDKMVIHGPINRDEAGTIVSVLGDFRGLYTTHGQTVRLPEKPEDGVCNMAPGGEGLFWLGKSYPHTYLCSVSAKHPYDGAAILYLINGR
jgi:hypothetical protein